MSKKRNAAAAEEDSDSDVSIVNVDFDFFNPRPTDYAALRRLLGQLFQGDADRLQTHQLTDLIIAQPLVGTTIKVDGIDSDPYACLTVLNLTVHKETLAIKALVDYISEKTASTSTFHKIMQELFSSSDQHVGFVFSERLINMPVATVPPMYQMLSREIQWAIDENEPYSFSHFLFISRTWRPQANSAVGDDLMRPATKRLKVDNVPMSDNGTVLQPFHPEDMEIIKFASHTVDYEFSGTLSRSDALGMDMAGRMMLVPSERFALLVEALAKAYPA